jgi:hypothetical protein
MNVSAGATRRVLVLLVATIYRGQVLCFLVLTNKQKKRTFFFTENSYYIMALPKIGNHRVIHSQRREAVYSIWKCLSEEALSGIKIIY